ncbi:MAG: hypothetical protein M3Y81_19035 [Chloroflexota bacterium]|nr:hypothetical protein [Chloroflexota bacterium]
MVGAGRASSREHARDWNRAPARERPYIFGQANNTSLPLPADTAGALLQPRAASQVTLAREMHYTR